MPPMTLTFPSGEPITNYSFDDEAMHSPGPEENWQESVAMWWFDAKNQMGGFMRVGHEPRMEGGNTTLWSWLQTPDWVYARNEQFPLHLGDVRENGQSAGGIGHYEYDGTGTRWWLKDGDTEYDLRLTPLHQPIGLYPTISADYAKNVGGKHFELADRLEGKIRIKGVTRRVSGYAYRDHSWGARNWWNLRVHRWSNGLIGEEFGFAFSNYVGVEPAVNRRGFVRLGSVVHYTREVDILPIMEADGATHRGGIIHATLENGDIYRFDLAPFGMGNMARKRDNYCYDCPCRVTLNGKVGIAMLELSENALRGKEAYMTLVNAPMGNGVFPAH